MEQKPTYNYRSSTNPVLSFTSKPQFAESYSNLDNLMGYLRSYLASNTAALPEGSNHSVYAEGLVLLACEPRVLQALVSARQEYDSEALSESDVTTLQTGSVELFSPMLNGQNYVIEQCDYQSATTKYKLPNGTFYSTVVANLAAMMNYLFVKYRPRGTTADFWEHINAPGSDGQLHYSPGGQFCAWIMELSSYKSGLLDDLIDLIGRINSAIVGSMVEHFRLTIQGQGTSLKLEEKDGTPLANFIAIPSGASQIEALPAASWAILAIEAIETVVDLNNVEVI